MNGPSRLQEYIMNGPSRLQEYIMNGPSRLQEYIMNGHSRLQEYIMNGPRFAKILCTIKFRFVKTSLLLQIRETL